MKYRLQSLMIRFRWIFVCVCVCVYLSFGIGIGHCEHDIARAHCQINFKYNQPLIQWERREAAFKPKAHTNPKYTSHVFMWVQCVTRFEFPFFDLFRIVLRTIEFVCYTVSIFQGWTWKWNVVASLNVSHLIPFALFCTFFFCSISLSLYLLFLSFYLFVTSRSQSLHYITSANLSWSGFCNGIKILPWNPC